MAGFDETTLRSGPAGDKKYVHGAFTEEYSAFWRQLQRLLVGIGAAIDAAGGSFTMHYTAAAVTAARSTA